MAHAITQDVTEIISRQFKIPFESLPPDVVLIDFGLDSLDLIEILFALEDKFGISIPYNANEAAAAVNGNFSNALGKLETIDQISAAVTSLMDAKAAE